MHGSGAILEEVKATHNLAARHDVHLEFWNLEPHPPSNQLMHTARS